jgi:EmrB/QacA subfamily drug resistance transporter
MPDDDSRRSEAPARDPRRRWRVLLVTAVAVFMAFLDVTIVNVAFPSISETFDETALADLSWILNAYNIVFAALLVPAGRIADLVGRRRMFLIGLALFLAASSLCAAAPSVEWLVGARVLQAVGAAIIVPASLGLLLPEFPLSMRATATAIWGATGAVAAAVGPSLGGTLVEAAGWRWVFLVNVPIGLAALLPAVRLLRERREPAGAKLPDALGVILLAVAVGAVSLGIVKAEDWGWGSARVLGAILGGVVVLGLFVWRSGRHPAPVIEPALFRVRSFAVASGAVMLFSLGFYALLLGNVFFLVQQWGYSTLEAGFALTPGPLMAALSAPIGGVLSDRFGQRVVAIPGGLSFAAGCTWFALMVGPSPAYAGEFLPGMFFTGIGVGLSFSALGSAAVAELPPSRFATGSAVSSGARQIGAVLGIAVLVAILDTGAGDGVAAFDRAWAFMAATGAAAGLTAIALGRVVAGPGAAPVPAERATASAAAAEARAVT